MNKFRILAVLALLAVVPACMEMDLENPNAPNAEEALANPSDVEALLATGFYRIWNGTQKTGMPFMISVAANEQSSSWGNFGMQDVGTVPRTAWDNAPTYGYRGSITAPWSNIYQSLSNMADGMFAIDVAGVEFISSSGENNTPRARAYARLSQGLGHGLLALMYDQAIIFDETIDLATAELAPRPYNEVMDAALGYLDDAIAIAGANTFTIPGGEDGWIHGRSLTNQELAQWAHSLKARFIANVARTPDERAAVDWNQVLFHVERGVQAEVDGPEGDGAIWWSGLAWYPNNWRRMAYDAIGMSDTSGGYAAWKATPWADRTAFEVETTDQRITSPDNPLRGSYIENVRNFGGSCSVFPNDRGTYFQSCYHYVRYEYHQTTGARGQLPYFHKTEGDLLRAEAALRQGDLSAALGYINLSRVGNGQMEPLTTSNTTMDEAWDWLHYEFSVEMPFSFSMASFVANRGWGRLVCGTPHHFPVPGGELEQLELPVYTTGGSNPGTAVAPGCRDM